MFVRHDMCTADCEACPKLARTAGSSHRLFLIDRQIIDPVGCVDGAMAKFSVLGATGLSRHDRPAAALHLPRLF
jgi:hypothetical protein